jgi:hypothetical protein
MEFDTAHFIPAQDWPVQYDSYLLRVEFDYSPLFPVHSVRSGLWTVDDAVTSMA